MPKPEGQEVSCELQVASDESRVASDEWRAAGWEIAVDPATGEERAVWRPVREGVEAFTVEVDLRTRSAKIVTEKTVQLGSTGASALREDLMLAWALVHGGGPMP